MLVISKTAKISRFADIEDSVKGSLIIIEDNVVIDSFVKIKPAGGMGDLKIGSDSVINAGVVIYTGNGITFGKHVMIAANCVFSPTSHEFRSKDIPIRNQGFISPAPLFGNQSGIIIEDDVLIGANCVVLEGARVRKGVVVTAGSIIKGELEEFGIYAGHPLRRIDSRR